jgi:PAS domain S-box-containing protein
VVDGPLNIVLIDDAVDVRHVVALQLRLSERFSVVGEGATGREAIELAGSYRPDLLLLDVSMPDMDGLNALPGIREASPGTKVVMFSGFSGHDLPARARALGAVDFIEKSLPIRDLPGRLLEVMRTPTATPAPAATPPTATPTPTPAPTPAEDASQGVFAEHLERFRDVFERATVGMGTLTLTGTIVRSNDALAGMIGTPAASLVGRSFWEVVDPAAVPELADATAAVVAGEASSRAVEHRLAVGEHAVRSTLATVRDTAGRPLYLFLQVEDITARRAAQEALRRSDERFGLLVSSVVDYAIYMLDPGGHVMTWNAGAERIKGWTAEEILGEHFRCFYTEEARASRHPELELEIALGQGRYDEEGWRVRKDGSRFWASVVITALLDHDGHLVGFGKVTRDVTQRQQAMDALAQAKEDFAAAAAEKARFLAVAAHELRSPTASVSAAASMLRNRSAELDEHARGELLDALFTGTNRIRRLVEDILLASQLEERALRYTTSPVDVADAVIGAIRTLPDGPSIEVRVPPGCTVLADAMRLGQVLTNLLANAATYGAPPISVEVAGDDGDPVIRVIDAGAGVPEDLVRRLFTPFTRGPGKPDRGTGLGLFIVRELARGMGGDAWYERQGGRTAFAVRLPSGPPGPDRDQA